MAKPSRRTYTLEQKSALVAEIERLYKAGGRTYVSIARELGISDTSYHTWVAAGIIPGVAGGIKPASSAPVPASRPRVVYTPVERDRLVAEVRRLHAAGQTQKEACRQVGIGEKTFRVWRAQRRALPPLRPVEVTALVPSAPAVVAPAPASLNLLAPGGYRVDGLNVETAAALLRALA